GGDGGVIAMDAKGNIATPHNTAGMYRASINVDGELFIGIFSDD
ncbi:MAG: beta-aspartyl-peptidase (threonine type), partial [Bacteroidia bacterium]